MRIAVVADIHANFPALLAVTEHLENWGPDMVFVAGDVVNRGPKPLECLRFVQNKEENANWLVVRGNHEDYVITHDKPDTPQVGPVFDLHCSSHWTYKRLNSDVSDIEAYPFQVSRIIPGGGEFRVTHASMRNNRDGIYPFTSDDDLEEKIAPPPAVICVGHTHRPLIRDINNTLVVNAGSSGLPFDGDKRLSYAQITWHRGKWNAEIIRLTYDIDQADRDFFETGFIEEAGPLAELMLVELRLGYSQLYQWTFRYRDLILSEEITMQESVKEYLKNPNKEYV